jgi:GNAT superfamily N-acetyltransferase
MEVRRLLPGDEELVSRYLSRRVSTCMIPYNNFLKRGLDYNGQRYEGDYYGIVSSGELHALAVQYWNGMLAVGPESDNTGLMDLLSRSLTMPLAGLLGSDTGVDAAVTNLGLSQSSFAMDSREDLFDLNLGELIEPSGMTAPGIVVRPAQPADEDLLTAWRVAYRIEVLGGELGETLEKEVRESVVAGTQEGIWWVMEKDAEPVSMTGFNARVPGTVQVGGVYTPPEQRSKGYARIAVAASLRASREEGYQNSILFTGHDQHAAQKVYRALGYRVIGGFRLLVLKTED